MIITQLMLRYGQFYFKCPNEPGQYILFGKGYLPTSIPHPTCFVDKNGTSFCSGKKLMQFAVVSDFNNWHESDLPSLCHTTSRGRGPMILMVGQTGHNLLCIACNKSVLARIQSLLARNKS